MDEEFRAPTYASIFYPLGDDEWFFEEMFEEDAVEKIQVILKTVSDLHKLPLALTWTTHRNHDHLHVMDAACYVKDSSMQGYFNACAGNRLWKGQNVAGKAVNLMRHHSVPNVSLLDLDDYPFVHDARNFGLRAAMAIRLKRNHSGPIEYVSEIFLPTNLEDKAEQNNLIVEILLSLRKNCEASGTMELQIESLPCEQVDLMLNVSKEVEASNFSSLAVSGSSLAFSNVGLNLKEKIPNNSLETNEPQEQAAVTECKLSKPEKQGDQTSEVFVLPKAIQQHSSYGGLSSNEKITGKTDEPNSFWLRKNCTLQKSVAEMHDRHQIMSINERKRTDTQQTKCTPKSRKSTSVVWEFFSKDKENGEVWAECPKCSKKLRGNSKNGTSNLHKHICFKDWKKDAKQQPVSIVKSSTKLNPKTKASTTKGANASRQTKRRLLGEREEDEEREEEETSGDSIAIVMAEVQDAVVPDIVQAAVSGLVHVQVQELTVQKEPTAKETLGSCPKDQEQHLLSSHVNIIELAETQSSGQQANNTTIDGTIGVPQAGCNQIELTAEGRIIATSTTSIPTTNGFSAISAASELKSFLSQSPRMWLFPTEIDRLCSLLDAEINAASNESEKHLMRELLAELHRLKESIATCSSSSRPKSSPLQRCENLVSTISQSVKSRSNLEAEITSLNDQAAQLEEQLKAINEQRTHKELELSRLKKDDDVHALQISQAIVNRLKIDNIVAGISTLFGIWSEVRSASSSSSK